MIHKSIPAHICAIIKDKRVRGQVEQEGLGVPSPFPGGCRQKRDL